MTGSSQNHLILDALREKAESHPELQALIHNVQQGGTEPKPTSHTLGMASTSSPWHRAGLSVLGAQKAPGDATIGISVPLVCMDGAEDLPPHSCPGCALSSSAVCFGWDLVPFMLLMCLLPCAQRTATQAQMRRSLNSAWPRMAGEQPALQAVHECSGQRWGVVPPMGFGRKILKEKKDHLQFLVVPCPLGRAEQTTQTPKDLISLWRRGAGEQGVT